MMTKLQRKCAAAGRERDRLKAEMWAISAELTAGRLGSDLQFVELLGRYKRAIRCYERADMAHLALSRAVYDEGASTSGRERPHDALAEALK